jgi:hypothetical protein
VADNLKLDSATRKQMQGGLHEAKYSVYKLRDKLRSADLTDQADLSRWWADLHALRVTVRQRLAEIMAIIEGRLTRQLLGAELHSIVDELLVDMAKAILPFEPPPLAALAPGESFSGELVPTIRIRFTETGVWDLPIIAHEFAHYAVSRFHQRRSPMADDWNAIVDAAAVTTPEEIDHLMEYFADVFATYTIGPAYALACLMRFSPFEAGDSGTVPSSVGGIAAQRKRAAARRAPRHPSAAARMEGILTALSVIDLRQRHYAGLIGEIRDTWRAMLRSAGQPEWPQAPEWLGRFIEDSVGFMDGLDRISSAGYARRWPQAWMVARRLKEASSAARGTELHAIDDPDIGSWDVVNGAWVVLFENGPEVKERLDRLALEWCSAIANRHAADRETRRRRGPASAAFPALETGGAG